MNAWKIRIKGIVQGVGFRPFVYRIAVRHGVMGNVLNDTEGVLIHAEADEKSMSTFIEAIRREAPAPSDIVQIDVESAEYRGATVFEIVPSEHREGEVTAISPDLATCPDCLRELFNPNNRRYCYPFINCTHCGPRYSIIEELPYDRPGTSMAPFVMCEKCTTEYGDVLDRRFHAQPNACEICGPCYELLDSAGEPLDCIESLIVACEMLREGKIIAVKGIGGFHLIADASNIETIAELRVRKQRPQKPFALMVRDIETARRICSVSESEARELLSPAAPIVLLKKLDRPEFILPDELASGLDRLGIFLPYAPVHHLLLNISGIPALIATSGNKRDEPIACHNDEVVRDLAGIADAFLVHDREIVGRTDDSVGFEFEGEIVLTRRSRGYVPHPIKMPIARPPILSVGADLKGTFALTRGDEVYLSPYLGDLTGEKSIELFEEVLDRYLKWLKIRPDAVVCDLHPDYASTVLAERFATEWDIPLHRVQHHFAHALSVIAEHKLSDDSYIAVAFDGHGYDPDGTIWGGEFLLVDGTNFERTAHLAQVPQPGGDIAAKDARRMALSWAFEAFGKNLPNLAEKILRTFGESADALSKIVEKRRSPLTSSAGRLFDAVACILGVCCENTFEGECPQKLTAIADRGEVGEYHFAIGDDILDPSPAIREIFADIERGLPPKKISARFHNGLARGIVCMSKKIAQEKEIDTILLTGGVFQNPLLLKLVVDGLRETGLKPYWNRTVPPGDSGVALGQALYGLRLHSNR